MPDRFQPTPVSRLEAALLCLLLGCLGAAFFLRLLAIGFEYSPVVVIGAAVCVGAATTWLSRRWSGVVVTRAFVKRSALVLLAAAGSGSLYAFWAHHRLDYHLSDEDFPRSWPYPDHGILALNEWYDARYPVRPGFLKIHSEFPKVRVTFEATLFVLSGVCGLCVGAFVPPRRRDSG